MWSARDFGAPMALNTMFCKHHLLPKNMLFLNISRNAFHEHAFIMARFLIP